jgi:hypothetical protein
MPDVTKDPLESEPKAGDDDFRLTLDEGPPSKRGETERPNEIGRTSGGGNLGHNQPDDVVRDRKNRSATGSDDDLVMPRDDATLKTKI